MKPSPKRSRRIETSNPPIPKTCQAVCVVLDALAALAISLKVSFGKPQHTAAGAEVLGDDPGDRADKVGLEESADGVAEDDEARRPD